MIFFFLLLFLHRGGSESLVIRSFITLPARHSAVGGNAISPDSHNYPQIEREKWGWEWGGCQRGSVGQGEFRWGRNAGLDGENKKNRFIFTTM